MARGRINPEDLGANIMKALEDYSAEVAEGTHKAVDIVSVEVMDEIKKHVSFRNRTGKYVKSFAIKNSFTDKYNKRNTWHVKAPHYRKTHLLESGHKKRSGGKTRAYPHIIYGEELADRRLHELIEKVVKGEKI